MIFYFDFWIDQVTNQQGEVNTDNGVCVGNNVHRQRERKKGKSNGMSKSLKPKREE